MTSTIDDTLPKDWPAWMRQARQSMDWGIALIFAFSLSIAMPFLTQPDLPHTNANENYVYRTADYAAALQEGRLYPRWSVNAFSGYGAPIPHYFPPGAGYTAAVIQVLFTNDPILAVRILYAIALGIAGVMIYLLVTRRAGGASGLLAGMLYVYSPYVGLTAPQILGDLPGVLALALMPMLLWATDRLVTHNKPLDVALVTLTTSALLLTHLHTAVVAIALGVLLALWHKSSTRRKTHFLLLLGSYLLGVGIASFYWIPILLEPNDVRWITPRITQQYKLTLEALFAPLQQIDLGEMVHAPQLTIGMAGIGFALGSIISVFRFGGRVHFQALFLICGLILITVAVFIVPDAIWLLGPIMLCLSISGSAVAQFGLAIPKRWQGLFLCSLCILIWIIASPVWLAPVTTESFGDTDDAAQVEYEQQGYGIAVVPPNEPIPTTINPAVPANRFLYEGYQSGVVNKIPPSQLNTALQIGLLDHNTHSDTYQIRAETPVTVDILTAYFPGWRATISDRPISLVPDKETGLMQIEIPATNNGELSIVLGSTSIRTAAWVITWDLLCLLVIISWGRLRRSGVIYDQQNILSLRESRLITLVLIICTVIIFIFNNLNIPLSLRIRPGYRLQNSTTIQSRSDSGLNLLAFRLNHNQFRPGQTLDLTLFWQAQRFLSENYEVRVHLVNNRDGSTWNYSPWHDPGYYPTRRWRSGLYVTDEYHFQLASDMTPGNYQINVEASLCKPLCKPDTMLTFFGTDGQTLGSQLILPTLLTVSS